MTQLLLESIRVFVILTLPFLLPIVFSGLVLGLLLSALQIQESSPTLLAKIVVVVVILVFGSSWFVSVYAAFTRDALTMAQNM